MFSCYICGIILNDKNRSIEHIFPNSIGGRLKSSTLLCKKCNSNYGRKSEAELSKQLNFFTNFLMIKRERGKPQHVLMKNEKTGEKYYINNKGMPIMVKPSIDLKEIDNKLHFSITARNIKEGREILSGLSRKYKNMDVDKILKQAGQIEQEIIEPLNFTLTVGGEEVLPAILKIALSYYIYKTRDKSSVVDAIQDLKIDKVESIIFEQRLYELDKGEVSHIIYLRGSQREKMHHIISRLEWLRIL